MKNLMIHFISGRINMIGIFLMRNPLNPEDLLFKDFLVSFNEIFFDLNFMFGKPNEIGDFLKRNPMKIFFLDIPSRYIFNSSLLRRFLLI